MIFVNVNGIAYASRLGSTPIGLNISANPKTPKQLEPHECKQGMSIFFIYTCSSSIRIENQGVDIMENLADIDRPGQ
jgi:hypothetical protein